MKKFIIKSIIFIIPFVIIVSIPRFIPFTFHDDLNRKINTLLEKDNLPDIYIAGDSRAERQLIPYIFEKRFGKKTVNIAVTSGDITRLYNALNKYDLIDKDKTLIISISSIEINDSVINAWGIPHATVAEICFLKNIELFGADYLNMLHERVRLMFDEIFNSDKTLNKHDDRIKTKGFLGVDGDISKWDFNSIDIHKDTLKVGWYIDAEYNGARKKVFERTIRKLADTGMNIILFQAPVSPSWYLHTKDTYIDTIELNHSKYLKNVSSLYKNISFIDFYTNYSSVSVYRDSMFYNSIHFNVSGAEIFSNMLVDSLVNRKLIKIDYTTKEGLKEWEYLE